MTPDRFHMIDRERRRMDRKDRLERVGRRTAIAMLVVGLAAVAMWLWG